jgi:hypothetical protein
MVQKQDEQLDQKEQFKQIENFIEELSVAVAQQKGMQFNNEQEADQHQKQTSQEIRQMLQQNSLMLKEGLQIYSERCTGFVADVSRRLLENLEKPTAIAKIIEAEIQGNQQALQAFSEAANSFYDCGDFHIEQCVLSTYMMLFPLHPQPYACFATMIWRKDGINAAETLYMQLVSAIEDPVLDYFAADCFVKSGNHTKARELIQRALSKTQAGLPEHQELRQHLLQLTRRCN